ncbi:MAG: carboxylesterase [Caulobacteraceae bacterium]|nr:carboxylesterase [Caulobacteraceae bacterium]
MILKKSLCLRPTALRALTASSLAAASFALASSALAEPVRVTIDSGVLVGQAKGEVAVFKGVPYAAAPVGKLRWSPPQQPASWSRPRPADAFGPICPQPLKPNGAPNEGGAVGPSSEDCLFLNLWAPRPGVSSAANPRARGGTDKAPVMVWVHGGGDTTGAGSLGAYDGTAFARDGVILVTLNYRLGPLGFFAHPAITKAAKPDEPLHNYGLMDQIAALEWVKRNIAAFGGDPANVTLFGESAGGEDTLALMTAPSAAGLFARAIVESGGGWGPPVTLAKREAEGQALAIKAGAPAHATLEQLRALPADAFAALPVHDAGAAVDGRLLKESVSQAFAVGHNTHVPLIIGSNTYEASLLETLRIPPAAILAIAPAPLKAAYADPPDDVGKARAMFTDAFMGAPARWIAAAEAETYDPDTGANEKPAFLYNFAYVAQALRARVPGAGHASEIPFVFASWETMGPEGQGLKPSADDLRVTAVVHGCWVAFAKSGLPVCPGAPAWPPYTGSYDTLMQFDLNPTLKTHYRSAQYIAQQNAVLPTLDLQKVATPKLAPRPPLPTGKD